MTTTTSVTAGIVNQTSTRGPAAVEPPVSAWRRGRPAPPRQTIPTTTSVTAGIAKHSSIENRIVPSRTSNKDQPFPNRSNPRANQNPTKPTTWGLCLTLLIACTTNPKPGDNPPNPDSGTTTGTDGNEGTDEGTDTGDDGTPLDQPPFANPPEAEDIDPNPAVAHFTLRAAPHTHTLTDWRTGTTRTVDGYAYNSTTPGPTLRVQLGQEVVVDITNDLDVPTTVHWHGIAVPYEMDGVTWSEAPIAPGETFTARFTPDRPGVAWYHPHFDTEHQVDHGLYGVLIVEDPADPPVDRELVMVLDDWPLDEAHGAEAGHVHGAHGAEGQWTVNGLVQPTLDVVEGELLRVRAVVASNSGYLKLDRDTLPFWVVGRDIDPLTALETPDTELLAPGDRLDLLLHPAAGAQQLVDQPYSLHGGDSLGEPATLLDLEVAAGDPSRPDLSAWPLTPEPPSTDPSWTDLHYTFQGDPTSDVWLINGERFPEVTVEQLSLGQEAVIQVRNVSATEHPFHLHGLHFEVLSRDGVPPVARNIEDTLNIDIYETVRLKVLADNPGFWMTHCHILPHGDNGMMTVLQVGEP
jgi:FtsP/CotA-like multicopper oxidase with cupredoxin domain